MHLDVEAFVGASAQMLQAQALKLAIDGLDTLAIESQIIFVDPLVGLHVLLANRDEA